MSTETIYSTADIRLAMEQGIAKIESGEVLALAAQHWFAYAQEKACRLGVSDLDSAEKHLYLAMLARPGK